MERFSDRTWQRQAIRFHFSNLNMRNAEEIRCCFWHSKYFPKGLEEVTRTEREKSRCKRNREAMAHSKQRARYQVGSAVVGYKSWSLTALRTLL
jgi:hypothetical protein